MHHEILRLHETYGPIIRLGPSEVSFVDAEAWKDIYSLKRSKQIQRCHKGFPAVTPYDSKYDLISPIASDHAKYRKILNPSFSDKATKDYEPAIQRNATELMSKFSASLYNDNPKVNITKWFQWLTFDNIGDVVWGDSFNCVKEERSHPCLALSLDLVTQASFVVLVAWWTSLKIFLIQLAGIEAKFVSMVRSKCKQNLETKSERASVFSNLMKDGNHLSQFELDGNLMALVPAGSETVGFAITTTTFYLAKDPEYFRRAAAEVRSAFTSEEEINDDALKKLPFLRAAISEAIRVTPTAPNSFVRRVICDGIDIRGHYIPRGVRLLCSASTHSIRLTRYSRLRSTSPNTPAATTHLTSDFPMSITPSVG